ncbi:MAG TPA: transporter associated domain-containing protein [Gammaproteobacteria bacterium]
MNVIPTGIAIGALLLPFCVFLLLRWLRAFPRKAQISLDTETGTRLLALEDASVEDVMVPRAGIAGIDLDDDWNAIREQLENSQHTRLPVYAETIDNVLGFLHLRKVLAAMSREASSKERLREHIEDAYFIPEATPLHRQLRAFGENRQRIGLVVDEYGDIRGLVTLADIVGEIIDAFATEPARNNHGITPEAAGGFLVRGNVSVRALNRALDWALPTDGPKTLNGLILETLETIPQPNTSVRIDGYPLEVVQTTRNAVKVVRVRPPQKEEDTALKTGEFTD